MQAFRLGRWGSTVLAPGNKQSVLLFLPIAPYSPRFKSTNVEPTGYGPLPTKNKRGRPRKYPTPTIGGDASALDPTSAPGPYPKRRPKLDVPESTYQKEQLPSPNANTPSPKLAALHARLSLSSRIPEQTLARCLVDFTADPDHRFNNSNLSQLGNELLGYYITEHLVCNYPRLPMVVLVAAVHAYVGSESLAAVAQGWGIEVAAEPGGEVNPGLLQFQRRAPTAQVKDEIVQSMQQHSEQRTAQLAITRGHSASPDGDTPKVRSKTLQEASRDFVQAVFGAIYLHCGSAATKEFFSAHILSRHLNIARLFTFAQPTRDLSRLCAREGFDAPVARVISETGRASRHPVFVVGVFSGRDKIGEDAGSSLHEARWKAAAKALKGWYLYSPKPADGEVMVPSAMLGQMGTGRSWVPAFVDDGEIIG